MPRKVFGDQVTFSVTSAEPVVALYEMAAKEAKIRYNFELQP